MAQIHARGKTQNKRFQFNAPTDLIDEFAKKKELLSSFGLTIDLTEDFVKALKDGVKTIDKKLAELGGAGTGANTEPENQPPTV
ncbi:hypothetical protein J4Z08_23120 [Citrobacter portucalensis]|uniref:hypothetical protein n=1 Tax=Citrobacter portucalensis TaxID=1639133 RepID=UPI0031405F5C